MTLIAAMRINQIPIILGDLLISRERKDDGLPRVSIPYLHSVNTYLDEDSQLQVVGLSQKVNIISENFCVAWAGRKYQARALIRHLHEKCGGRTVTVKEFEELLDQYPIEKMDDLDCIAYLYDYETKGFWRKNRNMPMFDPLFDIDKSAPIEVPDTDYKWLIHFFHCKPVNNAEGFVTHVSRFGSNNRPIQIEMKSDRYQIKFEDAYIQKLFKDVVGSGY